MKLVETVKQWYSLTHGRGKRLLDQGAELMVCPFCEEETPIFQSEYNTAGMPVSFSVCLWCEGVIEYSEGAVAPHEPYATARDLQAEAGRSKS